MGASKRVVFLLLSIATAVLAASAAGSHSLYVVETGSEAVVAALLAQGFTVSHRLPEACFVFGGPEVTAVAERLGCRSHLLDRETDGWEHFLVRAEASALGPLPAPCRLASRVGKDVVVAVPAGRTDLVLALRREFIRLYPRPIRLPSKAAPKPGAPHLAAGIDFASLVAKVSAESLAANVFWLEGMGTRNAKKAGGQQAAEWLAARFRGFGITQVEIQQWSSVYAGNVVATLAGSDHPAAIYVLGGHYDSIVHAGGDFEPGADDNASGTATLLEIARLLAGQRLASTVRFIAFGAEEWGLVGSDAYASAAALRGESIQGMLNFDMLGYRQADDRRDLDLITNDASTWLMQAGFDAAAAWVPELRVVHGKLLIGRSDHESFWTQGYPAIFFFEDSNTPSPFLHTTADITGVSYNDTTLHAQSTRVALALVATLAGAEQVPVTLQSFAAERQGSAVHLVWEWAAGAARELAGVAVERAPQAAGPWEERAMLESGAREYVDASGAAAETSWYRLALLGFGGERIASPAVQVEPGALTTALESVYETTAQEPVHVRFSVGAPVPRLMLGVYDVRGRLVRVLSDGPRGPGEYLLAWDRRDRSGAELASGVYVVHLHSADATAARKLVLVR